MAKFLVLLILSVTVTFLSSVSADVACLRVTLKRGKPVVSVKTVQTSMCPKGFKAVVDTATLTGPKGDKGDKGDSATLSGVAAGGALGGTYPNPSLANESVSINNFSALPGAKITRSIVRAFNNSFATLIEFDNEAYDNMGFYPGSGSTITIPVSGLYFIKGQINFVLNSSGSRNCTVLRNSNVLFESTWEAASLSFTNAVSVGVERLEQGDTLTLRGSQSSGGVLNSISSGGGHAFLQVQWVAP
jgi:hypothetical protein